MQPEPLFISIVMPVRNEGLFVCATVRRLLTQDYPKSRFEIIVVDGCSTDDTAKKMKALSKKHKQVRLIENPKKLSSAARNIGVRKSQGDVVVIIDGHCEIPNLQLLKELSNAFLVSGADIIGRPQPLTVKIATNFQKAVAAARASWLGHHPDSYIYSEKDRFVPAASVGVAYKTSVFDRIGFFDESFDACEDVELNSRADAAGLRCFFSTQVQINYYPRCNLRQLALQLNRYGQGRFRLHRKHKSMASIKSFLPAWFLLGVILGPLTLLNPGLFAVYLGTLCVYGFCVLATTLWIAAKKRSALMIFQLPVVFLTIHFAAGGGILQQFIADRFPFFKLRSNAAKLTRETSS